MDSAKTKIIRQKVLISAKPEQVYDALVNAKKHSTFTGSTATGAARVGARFTAWDGYISGTYLALEKGKRITQKWQTTEWPEGSAPSLLDLILKSKGKGTELTMVHSQVPAEQAAAYAKGWKEFYWSPLKRFFTDK
jgi:uncharacterized protein YndB with AHSA1/START domain